LCGDTRLSSSSNIFLNFCLREKEIVDRNSEQIKSVLFYLFALNRVVQQDWFHFVVNVLVMLAFVGEMLVQLQLQVVVALVESALEVEVVRMEINVMVVVAI
jgi:hypothetical protein